MRADWLKMEQVVINTTENRGDELKNKVVGLSNNPSSTKEEYLREANDRMTGWIHGSGSANHFSRSIPELPLDLQTTVMHVPWYTRGM